MKPMAAALVGALISGVAMYGVGTRAQDNSPFVESPALVQTVDGRIAYVRALQPRTTGDAAPVRIATTEPVTTTDAAPVRIVRTAAQAPTRRVYRDVAPDPERTVYREADRPRSTRSKTKTILMIGGSAASGAGLGGLLGGKKGALVGAALGGGAASIYEATRR